MIYQKKTLLSIKKAYEKFVKGNIEKGKTLNMEESKKEMKNFVPSTKNFNISFSMIAKLNKNIKSDINSPFLLNQNKNEQNEIENFPENVKIIVNLFKEEMVL